MSRKNMLYVIEDIGLRNYQEDRHCIKFNIYENMHYYAVFDGHGSDKVSVFLKLYFHDILKSELENTVLPVDQQLKNAFRRLTAMLPEDIAKHAGSTAVVMLEHGDKIYVANVGDSRAIMNVNEKAVPITVDHKPNLVTEYNRIIKNGGFVAMDPNGTPRVNGNLALSRAIGDLYLVPYISPEPDIFTVELNESVNYIVLASDGVWDVFKNQEVIDIIESFVNKKEFVENPKKQLQAACMHILKVARMRGSGDNITILLRLL